MRYLQSLLFILLFANAAIAQRNLHLSFHTGVLNNSLNFVKTSNIPYDAANLNIVVDLRLWKEYQEKWQVGVSVENGIIQNVVDFRMFAYQNNLLVLDVAANRRVDVLSPAIMPNVFGNYILKLPRNSYMYGGAMAGAITGRNTMGDSKHLTSFLVGANLGISFEVSEAVRFSIGHGYRFSHINMPQDIEYIQPPDGNGNYSYFELSDFDLQFFVNTISIGVKL